MQLVAHELLAQQGSQINDFFYSGLTKTIEYQLPQNNFDDLFLPGNVEFFSVLYIKIGPPESP